MTNYSAYGVIAVGCLFVIISGGIDISFMAVGAVAQYLSALYMIHRGGNFVMIYLIAIVTGTLLGFINGTGKQAEGPYVDHYDWNDERDLWRDDEGDQRRPAAWLPGVVLQEGGILFIRGFRGNACGSHGNCLVHS